MTLRRLDDHDGRSTTEASLPGTFWQSLETRRRGGRLIALVLMSAFAMVIAPASAAAELPEGCSELNFALTEHTCFHARFGPFEERTATDGAIPTAGTPDIDTVHTHYRVALTPGRTQVVTYAPARTASWAVFVDPAVPYSVQRPDGVTLSPVLEHDVTDCPFLPRVRVYEFEAGVRYRYVFGPSPSSSLVVLNEKVDDFDVARGRDADGDGYGDPALADFRACEPLPGFVESDDDCNDADPAVHPGAVEICDGVDQNCNGIADDIGDVCFVGSGACAARGVNTCPIEGAAAVCAGTPLPAAGPETCNGVDDDCDGFTDEGDLCLDPERPLCVSSGPGRRFCGCERDADCGGPGSARLCFLMATTQRCVDGCVDDFGRNDCAAGLVCTSFDPATPGTCVPGCASDIDCLPQRCDPRSLRCVAPEVDAGPAAEGDSGARFDAGADDGAPLGAAGCGCHVSKADAPSAGWLVLLVIAAALARRARSDRAYGARWVAAGVFYLTSCTASRVTPEDVDGGPCVPQLGRMLLEHSCVHVDRGPLREADATTSPDALPPNVSRSHIPYLVFVPGDGTREGFVGYRPSREGAHVVMGGPEVAIDVRNPSTGELVPVSHSEATSTCAGLRRADVVSLARGQLYRIALRPAAGVASVVLFIEHIGAFGDDAWALTCR